MSITVDYGANDINVFTDTVTRWDDDPERSIDSEARDRIIDNIFRALTYYQERHQGKVALLK